MNTVKLVSFLVLVVYSCLVGGIVAGASVIGLIMTIVFLSYIEAILPDLLLASLYIFVLVLLTYFIIKLILYVF